MHSMLFVLKLAAFTSLIALSVALPLFMAGTPCLDSTSPSNDLGGRLGSLTDMSLLRLLNALDPSPGSPPTSNKLHIHPHARALPSTIAPAIGSARTRLIVLLVIITILGCGGGLLLIFRTYHAFSKYQRRFNDEICGGMDMVVVPSRAAPNWSGLSEEAIKAWFQQRSNSAQPFTLEVVGAFGIP